jgi:hypothetical protein
MKRIYALMFILFFTAIIYAQIPGTLSYQGVLTDASGNPNAMPMQAHPKSKGLYYVTVVKPVNVK